MCPELLTEVIIHLQCWYKGTHLLCHLLHMNNAWSLVTEHQLYHSIFVAHQTHTRLLANTLSHNARLALLVFSLTLVACGYGLEETKDHISILHQCMNIRHMHIFGYNALEIENYHATLCLKSLISFFVSCILDSPIYAGFCNMPELLNMMSSWPKLEKLEIHCNALDLSDGFNRSMPSDPVAGLCPHLCNIQFIVGNKVHGADVLALLAIQCTKHLSNTSIRQFRKKFIALLTSDHFRCKLGKRGCV